MYGGSSDIMGEPRLGDRSNQSHCCGEAAEISNGSMVAYDRSQHLGPIWTMARRRWRRKMHISSDRLFVLTPLDAWHADQDVNG